MEIACGLDFGTTNSTLAINKAGRVEMVSLEPSTPSDQTMRSVLYFGDTKGTYVGQEAILEYLRDGAQGRFLQSIKSFLPDRTFDITHIRGDSYQLDDLIAVLLRVIKKKGELSVGQEISSVTIGRPVIFSEDTATDRLAESRLRSAAEKAGFKCVRFQFEPIAAGLAFESTLEEGEEKKVLVGDFGGGTSDFTVIRLRGGGNPVRDRKSDILSLQGVYIGGDGFDSRIMWNQITPYYGRGSRFKGAHQWLDVPTRIFSTLCSWHLIPRLRNKRDREDIRQIRINAEDQPPILRLEDLIDRNYGFKLFQAIEKAKLRLSQEESAIIEFSEGLTDIHNQLTRHEFESMIMDDIDRIEKCVLDTVTDSGLREGDIDVVFLTGGSSFIPRIRQIFERKFGEAKLKKGDAFTSIGYGLGLSASNTL